MFNLIVNAAGWSGTRGTFPAGRLFEYTEDALHDQFGDRSNPNLEALRRLPTLFMEETFDNENKAAHIGSILQVRSSGREISLEYSYDPEIRPITNRELTLLSLELDINDFEFSRTHWAIKDVDLFRVLLRNLQPRRITPKVFQVADPERIEPTLVSAMMPFHPHFDAVYVALKEVTDALGLRCRRADNIWENPAVIQDVVSLIDRSKLVICDCTQRNPNVFYEIGIAHTLGRDVILITQSESDIPFDLRHLRFVKYLNNGEGLVALKEKLLPRLQILAE